MNACVVLHNICIINNVDLVLEENNVDFEDYDNYDLFIDKPRVNPQLMEGRWMQRRVINYFR